MYVHKYTYLIMLVAYPSFEYVNKHLLTIRFSFGFQHQSWRKLQSIHTSHNRAMPLVTLARQRRRGCQSSFRQCSRFRHRWIIFQRAAILTLNGTLCVTPRVATIVMNFAMSSVEFEIHAAVLTDSCTINVIPRVATICMYITITVT